MAPDFITSHVQGGIVCISANTLYTYGVPSVISIHNFFTDHILDILSLWRIAELSVIYKPISVFRVYDIGLF